MRAHGRAVFLTCRAVFSRVHVFTGGAGGTVTPAVVIAVRPIALTKPQAAAALGVSVDSFERHIQPDLRVIRRGRLRLFAVAEIERWADEQGERTLAA